MQLSADDRDFFRRVSDAAFANPFGDRRYALDAELTGLHPDAPDIVERLLARVTDRLDAVGRPRGLPRDEAEWVEHATLFEAFHTSAEPFDALIAGQATSETPVPFPAHAAIGADLVRRGFGTTRVPRALELFYQLRRAYTFLSESQVGRSECMRRFRARLWSQVFTQDVRRYERHLWNRMEDFSTILLGETGTGKTAAAAAIGRSGFIPWAKTGFAEGFGRLFLPLNLSELPGTLVESALFGHEKGAFTGAIARHPGAFARTSPHGVIFLDEIGEVSIPTQIKLLRVLQERVFTPVGGEREERFEGRVIAATHRSLTELRADGRFRDDFYYRLCSDIVVVPTLRERLSEDDSELELLLEVVVERMVGQKSPELSAEVASAVRRDVPHGHLWEGNVRELEQAARRVLLSGSCAPQATSGSLFARAEAGELDAQTLLEGYCAHLYRRHGSYEAVARVTALDRRTVKKYVLAAE